MALELAPAGAARFVSRGTATDRQPVYAPGGRRMLAIGEILLCSSVPTQILIGAILAGAGMAPTAVDGKLSLPFVLVLSIGYGQLPWISLVLAFSFATYGLVKKKVNIGGLESLAAETTIQFSQVLFCLGAASIFCTPRGAPWMRNRPTESAIARGPPANETSDETLSNGVGRSWPSFQTRIVPPCSTMKSRPDPSPACVT